MELSSPDRQSIQEVATPNKTLHIWICLFQLCKFCFGSWGRGNHSTAQTAMQQHVVEHGEHDKARSHGHPLHPGIADTVLPLDPARSERESDLLNRSQAFVSKLNLHIHSLYDDHKARKCQRDWMSPN